MFNAFTISLAVLILYGLVCLVRLYFASRSMILTRIATSLAGIENLLRQQMTAQEPPSPQSTLTPDKPPQS